MLGCIYFKKKELDENNMTYYTISSFVGQHANCVFKKILKKYPRHKIFLIANQDTESIIDKSRSVIICYDDNNIVKVVKIYN